MKIQDILNKTWWFLNFHYPWDYETGLDPKRTACITRDGFIMIILDVGENFDEEEEKAEVNVLSIVNKDFRIFADDAKLPYGAYSKSITVHQLKEFLKTVVDHLNARKK